MGKTGIIYIMTTSVKGLIKIGKTDNFKNRMSILEQNGYWNVSGLHPFYAVRVKNYDEKEKLIHTVFSKSQVANSELFALDKDVAKKMLEAFDGEQVFPDLKNDSMTKDTGMNNKVKASRLTFEMLDIPVGSTLVYIPDNSIVCKTTDLKNGVEYKGEKYKLSALVKLIKKGGNWQGGEYFAYNGQKLTDIRRIKGL